MSGSPPGFDALRGDPLCIRTAALEAADETALICSGRRWTFGELAHEVEERIERIERFRCADSERPIDSLALVGERSFDALLWLYAALELHLPVVLVHPRWTEAERLQVFERTAVGWLAEGDRLESLAETRSAIAGGPRSDASELRDAACVVFTSGTSGSPKGALLPRRALLAAASASADRLGWHRGDRWLLNLPLGHVGGLSVVTRTLIARTTVVVDPEAGFQADRFVERIREDRVTLGSIVPTMLARIVSAGLTAPPSLRLVLLGGARADPAQVRAGRRLGWPLVRTYGMTEHCSQIATESPDRARELESVGAAVGRPLEGCRVRLVEVDPETRRDTGSPSPLSSSSAPEHGDPGLLQIRGPSLFCGYLGESPSATFEDGWFSTGDFAVQHPDGSLEIVDRRSDLIVTGGENVYPSEIERHLLALGGVEECCVFGIADPEWGQRVVAAVVLRPGREIEDLVASLRRDLASFKVPSRWLRLEKLPRVGLSKVDRGALRRLAAPAGALYSPVERASS